MASAQGTVANTELEESREYRLLAESMPNLAWIAKADGSIYWYNQRWYEYTETTPEEMEGWGWQSVHDPAVLSQVLVRWNASIQSAQPFEMTFPIRGGDGIFRPFLTRIVPLKNSLGRVTRWFGTNTEIGELTRITNNLRESERRFQTATKAVNSVLWTNDAKGEMRGEQPAWAAFTGQTIDQYQGYGWSKVIHPDDVEPTIVAWQEAVHHARLFSVEHRVLRRDGEYRLCSVRALPSLDENGAIQEWVGVHNDITEDRATRQALADTDERLRMALTAANGVGTWDWDVPNDRVYVNEGFARIYGVDPAKALTGLPVNEFLQNIYPEDAAETDKSIRIAMKTGEDYRAEYRLVQPDGSIRWLSTVGRCKLDDSGKPLRFPGVSIDITDMRRADEALRTSEEGHRIAAEVTRLGHCRLDTATRTLISCTAIFKANYGRSATAEFTYDDLLHSVHPDDLPRVKETVGAAIREDKTYRADYRVIWPDGSLHWISASGRLIHFGDGRTPQMAGVSLDVTQKHLSELALLQTEKLAAVGRLASSIAHEINNPLESVTNLLYLARHSTDLQEIHRRLDSAEQELRRVSIIANQTLRFHKQSSSPIQISCNDLFATVLSMYEGKLRNSGIHVEKRKRAKRSVRVYEGDIRQVLNNLVGNAVDAMPNGGRLIVGSRESRNWRTDEPGMVLTVADTGSGMTAETRARMFDAFFTTKGINGTGLGLWISNEIMQRHRGHIAVRSSQSAHHRGTVITLFLPFDGPISALQFEPPS